MWDKIQMQAGTMNNFFYGALDTYHNVRKNFEGHSIEVNLSNKNF